MEIEVAARRIPSSSQNPINVRYKGQILKKFYVADLICYEKIIVEIKAMENLTGREDAQLLNYLKATGIKVGVLINFGHYPNLEWKRLILTKEKPGHPGPRAVSEDEAIYQSEIGAD